MIVVDKNNIVMGSNAVKTSTMPKETPNIRQPKKKKQQVYYKEHSEYTFKKNMTMIGCITVLFLMGMFTVYRITQINRNQVTISNLNKSITEKKDSIANYKSESSNRGSDNVESDAERLGFVKTTNNNLVKVDFTRNYFEIREEPKAIVEKGFFGKLIEVLF